jgi:cytochrome oxidase assembly protein ShyY1
VSFWKLARRPRWIAALALALGVAAAFAALGQWQLERSLETAIVDERDTETPVPLASVAEPQQVMTTDASGRMVTVTGAWVEGDEVIVTGRLSGVGAAGDSSSGAPGDWVLRHLVTENGASLAVAVGFVEPGASIPQLPNGTEALVGRYVPSESPQISDFEEGERSAIATAELINLWQEVATVYSGYLVLESAPGGLQTIAAPAPVADVSLNLLNLFYAIEWVIFGGFAVYLWWRLVKDEQEKLQAAADEAAQSSARASEPGPQAAPVD